MAFIKNTIVVDDILFEPYMDDGYQAKIHIDIGIISVRYKGKGLIVSDDEPFEVFYPTDDSPTPYQTSFDVYNYILKNSKSFGYKYEMEFIPTQE